MRLSGARDLPNLFIPRRDQFFKVDAIPILGTGKLDLRALRKLAEAAVAEKVPAGAGAEQARPKSAFVLLNDGRLFEYNVPLAARPGTDHDNSMILFV